MHKNANGVCFNERHQRLLNQKMLFWVLVCVAISGCLANDQEPIKLNVQNWTQILTDEWMVELYVFRMLYVLTSI